MRKFLPSLPDIMAVAGLSLLGYGLYLVDPIYCYLGVGTILLTGGIAGQYYSPAQKPEEGGE